jgi:hypothetical protein
MNSVFNSFRTKSGGAARTQPGASGPSVVPREPERALCRGPERPRAVGGVGGAWKPWMLLVAVLGSAVVALGQPPNPFAMRFHGGVCDCASPGEPNHPSYDLRTYGYNLHGMPTVGFDDTRDNRWFGYTFSALPDEIVSAKLTITARPNASVLSSNDTLRIGRAGWTNECTFSFGTVFGNVWNQDNFPTCVTVTIDLTNLVGSSGEKIIETMDGSWLDVYVQDDTMIDCISLDLTLGPPLDIPMADGFDSYLFEAVCGQGDWEDWVGNSATCPTVSGEQALSGDRSLKLVGNVGGPTGQGDNTVHRFDLVGGRYLLQAMTYVPATATGTASVILLNSYPVPLNVSLNLRLDADNGTIHDGDSPALSAPLQKGVWVPVVVEVDLDSDAVNCFYGGEQFITNKSWQHGSTGNGEARIQALQLYAGEPGGQGTSGVYVDDLVLCQNNPPTTGCYANCDGSTATPMLTSNDFQCFLNSFAMGSAYANCDGSTVAPILNVNDFTCFMNAFAAGCS